MFRRQCEPANGGFPVLGNILAQQVQLSEGILGVLVSLLRRLRQPADSARCILCHAIAAQQQLAQLVLRELVSQISGLLEPTPGGGGIVRLQAQLAQGIYGVLIAPLGCLGEPDHRLGHILRHRPAVTVQLSEGVLSAVQSGLRRMGQPVHRLTSPLPLGRGICEDVLCHLILRIGVFQFSGLLQPLQRSALILLCPHAMKEHPADAVLHIAVGALPLHGLEGGERLGIPRMGLLHVSLHASAVRKHPTQVMHGQGVAVEGLLHEEAAGLPVILGRLVIPVQKRPRPLVSITPHHGGRRFAGLLRHIRAFRLRFRLVLPLAQDWRPRRPEAAPGYPPA